MVSLVQLIFLIMDSLLPSSYLFIKFHQMIISLENFDEQGRSRPILNSPRSIEACRRQGIEPEQLLIKTIDQLKQLYKDGMNDRKSLQIKMQHYQMRRKNKLQIVRKERMDIVQNVKPIYRPNHSTNRTRVQIIEVQNKLEKKKIMDEVKAELKQKELQIKNMKIQQKITTLQSKKKQEKIKKEYEKYEKQKMAAKNQFQNQIQHEAKINNCLFTDYEKEQKVQQALMEKKNLAEQIKKEKEAFYDQKSKYCKEVQQKMLNEKKEKVEVKFSELDRRLQQKEQQQAMYRRNLQQQRKKDEMWKETKRKQAEIEQKKRQSQNWEAIKFKQMKKQSYLQEIEGKKSRFYNNKKQDREVKEQLIKAKLEEDEKQIEKRRRIMELVQQEQRRQEQQRKFNQMMEIQSRREELIAREKQRLQKLKEEEQMNQINGQYILEKHREKEKTIEEKKKEKQDQQRQKALLKELKLKEAEQNRKRLEKIQSYEKQEQIEKYNQKVNMIEKEKKQQKSIKIVRKVSRQSIESKIISQHSLDRTKKAAEKKNTSVEKIQAIKKEARQNPIQVKQKMKAEEISKLIENLKVQCNKEEYIMMKEEEIVEQQRQQLEKTAENVAQLRRLQKIHGVQRARFQERLTTVMKANQEKVERYKKQLLK